MVAPVSHKLKIYLKIALHSNFSKFGELKVNKITRLPAILWVGRLNVAYMTIFREIASESDNGVRVEAPSSRKLFC